MGKFTVISALISYTTAFAVTSSLGLSVSQDIPSIPSFDLVIQNHELAEPPIIMDEYSPPVDLSMVELVEYYGYRIETHDIVTSDGYILKIFRITNRKNRPNIRGKRAVLVQHGILSSSFDWVLLGPEKALAYLLVEAGYDVWLGNARGNKYNRRHKYLSTNDKKFWDFSWHEIGTRDMPAMIDYILEETGQEKLFYIGHSQGTTVFFVMASQLPAYNDKIHAMFSLAPISYCSRMTSPLLKYLSTQVNQLQALTNLIGLYEFKPSHMLLKKFATLICGDSSIAQPICINALFLITGFNKDQFNTSLIPTIIYNDPAGASTKQFVHYAQLINSGHFEQYDYGAVRNLIKYGKISPPDYKIKNIRVPVSIHYSKNDWLANVKDVQKLYSQLPNPIGKFLVPDRKFNHIDYLFANNVKDQVYDKVISLMSRYKN